MKETQPQRGFRLDVNGLRAWAVVAVILFHFDITGFSGGFVGVDIFFVISGLLMTGIIIEKLEKNSFSIYDFYIARAKRIIPALAALCAVLMTCGWFFLQAPDYQQLASHATYSLSFLSNIKYLHESGYFDAASHEKWLLHTWSLSVEWQFYVILPVVLSVLWRFWPSRTKLLYALAMAAAFSFALCVIVTENNPAGAFFVLTYRAWEMLAGGLVFILSERLVLSGRTRQLLNGTGLAMIVVAISIFDKTSAWPSWNAVLPVCAASLVLLANQASFWTSNRVAQWLGDRSYSLYLWHWPVYVALVFSELRSGAAAIASALVLTLLLGHLSYVLVESRSKAWLGKHASMKASGAIALLLLIAALPAIVVTRVQGWPGRFPESIEKIARESGNSNPRRRACHTQAGTKSSGCRYGDGKDSVIVLGDSHADAVITGVASALDELDISVEQMSYSGCPFVTGIQLSDAFLVHQRKEFQCAKFVQTASLKLSSSRESTPIILVNRYAAIAFGPTGGAGRGSDPQAFFSKPYSEANREYIEEFSRSIIATACNLSKRRPVYLMRPIPEMGVNVPKVLSRRLSVGIQGDFSIGYEQYWQRNEWVWKAQDIARQTCNVEILDPTQALCRNGRCYGSRDGRPLYFDDNHLSEYGNKLLVPMYREAFKRKHL